MLTKILVLLALSTFLFLPPVSSAPRDQQTPGPEKPQQANAWNLADLNCDILQFYEKLATQLKSPLAIMLEPLSDSYSKRSYPFSEFESALRSLRRLIESGSDTALENAVSDNILRQTRNREELVLFLDPTCESCQHIFGLVNETRSLSSTSFPEVVMRVVPSSEDASIEAAIVLRSVEKQSPSSFMDAFREFLNLLPANPSLVQELSIPYIGKTPNFASPDYASIRLEILTERKRFNSAGYFPPIVSYRGRTLRKDQGADVPFDPLHDSQSLLQTIKLIRAFDAMRDGSSNP